ncbi:MAG: aminotransferase class I/II-fold pyridoxal phosphate-dependent enzyme [Xanthobacteraceae bacterium]
MIPILRPKLPTADRLAPYLVEIDRSRLYSNFGPHVRALQERLAARFGLPDGTVTTVANATLGLTLALMAQAASPGTLCVMPAWTFVASAHAVVLAGLTPYFVDVDPSTWALDPVAIEREIARAPGRVGAVMVVAPFGRPIDYLEWDEFKTRTGLPVVIDAAAAFDALKVGLCPAVVSLHATKVIGVGEGGFVASRDTALVRGVVERSNFGFHGGRNSETAAMNAKLSEYHAAVGLAALDTWSETRADWMAVAGHYRRALAESNSVNLQPGFGETWISSTCVVSIAERARDKVQSELTSAGIDTRMWWGDGVHRERAAAHYPRGPLPATETLAKSTLGLPFFRDLPKSDVQRVAETLARAVSL